MLEKNDQMSALSLTPQSLLLDHRMIATMAYSILLARELK
jgi:hypothetical protein